MKSKYYGWQYAIRHSKHITNCIDGKIGKRSTSGYIKILLRSIFNRVSIFYFTFSFNSAGKI